MSHEELYGQVCIEHQSAFWSNGAGPPISVKTSPQAKLSARPHYQRDGPVSPPFFGSIEDLPIAPPNRLNSATSVQPGAVAVCDSHSACVTASGMLYTWGHGDDGKLGHGDEQTMLVPTLVRGDLDGRRVTQMAAGGAHSHTVCVCADGSLFTWGRGEDGKLGHGKCCRASTPRIVKGALQNLSAECGRYLGAVVQAAAGSDHTGCVTRDGGLYTWGRGSHGRLGHGDEEKALLPRRVGGKLTNRKALLVSAGSHTTACITEDGALFTWGSGKHGMLGHGNDVTMRVPTQVGGELKGHRVIQVSVASQHMVCVTEAGTVYSWGCGAYGKLGHGGMETVLAPMSVQGGGLSGRKSVQVAAGVAHTVCLTQDGSMYSWGRGDDGRLGHGNEDRKLVPTRVESALRSRIIVQAAAGSNHTACVDASGALYTWGYGRFGMLGHGHESTMFTPTLVDMAAWVSLDTLDIQQTALPTPWFSFH